MAEFPALPLFTDAMIADTQHLSHQEFGLYVRLLMYAWRDRDCSLPTDRTRIGRMVHISPTAKRKFAMVEDILSQFFYEKNDKFFQKRLLKEKTFLGEKKQKDTLNGELGAVIKALKKLGYELSPPELTLKENDKPRLLKMLRVRLREAQAPTPTPTPLEDIDSVSTTSPNTDRESQTSTSYAFDGKVIRLNGDDLTKWKATYSAIPDIIAELQSYDDFLANGKDGAPKNWFHRTSAYLRNRHDKALEASKQAKQSSRKDFAC